MKLKRMRMDFCTWSMLAKNSSVEAVLVISSCVYTFHFSLVNTSFIHECSGHAQVNGTGLAVARCDLCFRMSITFYILLSPCTCKLAFVNTKWKMSSKSNHLLIVPCFDCCFCPCWSGTRCVSHFIMVWFALKLLVLHNLVLNLLLCFVTLNLYTWLVVQCFMGFFLEIKHWWLANGMIITHYHLIFVCSVISWSKRKRISR